MALVTYNRSNTIIPSLSYVLTDSGYVDVSGSPFLGSIVSAIQDALMTEYGKVYDIADNVDIGRASGRYLDRWGAFHAEDRATLSYASDLTLGNCYAYLDPTVTAGEITTLGDGLTITNMTFTDDAGTVSFEALDEVYLRPERSKVYCRVVCTTPGAIEVSPGQITKVNVTLSDFDNVLPSAIGTYTLKGTNTYSISGGAESATDADYKYILLQKAQSIGLFNEAKVNTLMDNIEVVNLSIQEYRGGANVYIESRTIENVDSVVATLRTALKQYRNLGLCVNIYAPIIRYFTGDITTVLIREDPDRTIREQLNSDFCDAVNAVSMGSNVDLQTILNNVVDSTSEVTAARVAKGSIAGRSLAKYTVGQYFNEKLLTSTDRITVS